MDKSRLTEVNDIRSASSSSTSDVLRSLHLWSKSSTEKTSPIKIFRTDKGTVIKGYREYSDKKGLEMHKKPFYALPRILEKYGLSKKATIKESSDHTFNCHSYTFTNGTGGWLSESQVKRILKDDQYQQISAEQARFGDIVIYRDDKKNIRHSGVITNVMDDGKIFVTSKWGVAALVEHEKDAVLPSYGKNTTIYRDK
jgi:hypothetical protein